jgi:predicted TIM-barrel fold metal-dependent hydrolase
MIIDVHGHLTAPPELYAFKARLLSGRGYHLGRPEISDERLEAALKPHLALLTKVGTELQFISPRPFQLMHSERPESIVRNWVILQNDLIARQLRLHPDVFCGIAGLPQSPYTSPSIWAEELERCVKDLGFIGTLINPDPGEGLEPTAPPMGHEYWYPLYEKMVELDVPGLIHAASCRDPRESYSNHFITEESMSVLSLIDSDVFKDFPDLKIIVAHGGGSVPYQVGRWRSQRWLHGGSNRRPFDEDLRQMYFDTVLYNQESLELLIKICGSDRVVFGTENPGTGGGVDPATGRALDDLRPTIEAIPWLSDQDRRQIFELNARQLYPRLAVSAAGPA